MSLFISQYMEDKYTYQLQNLAWSSLPFGNNTV